MFLAFFLSKKRRNLKRFDVEGNQTIRMYPLNSTEVSQGNINTTQLKIESNENRQNENKKIIEFQQGKKMSVGRGTISNNQLPCIEEVEVE